MKTTMDRAGRLVVPKSIRQAARISPGTELTIRVREGRIEIEPAPLAVKLVKRRGLTIAVPLRPVPPLTEGAVAETLDALRRRRGGDAGR